MKNMVLFFALVLLTSCTRQANVEPSLLTIQFPESGGTSINKLPTQETSQLSIEKPNFNFSNVPATYSDVDCLLVFIGGPEEAMRNNSCEKSSDKSNNFKFGVFAGTLSKNQTISLEVPSGQSRFVRLYGLKKPDSSKACPAIQQNGSDSAFSGFSAPYFLGESKPTEMPAGASVTVEIPVVATIDSSAYFDDCRGPKFGGDSGGGDGSSSGKPYLRLEGFHDFNSTENPSFFRSLPRGGCFPVTFKAFKPCNGGACVPHTLANAVNITFGTNIKFFDSELSCQNDTSPLSSVSIPAGQSQAPATGNFYARVPLANLGFQSTNLQSEVSLDSTTEVSFTQPQHTNIQIGKPKVVVSNLPSSITYGSCASGTTSTISVFQDTATQVPMTSHEVFNFESVFLKAQTLGCGVDITSILPNLASVSVNFGKPAAVNSGFSGGTVKSVVYDPALGKYYVGGAFTLVGGKTLNKIVRLNSDGSYDPTFDVGSGFDGQVNTMILDSTGGIYVGGLFSTYKGINAPRLAQIDGSGNLNPNFGFGVTGTDVKTLALFANDLYVGGTFTQINGTGRNNLAKIDVSGLPSLTAWNPNPNNAVFSIISNGSVVYVGGQYTTIGGQSRNRVAAIDAITGLATTFNPNPDNAVTAMVLNGSTLYIGGTFANAGGQSRVKIAAIDTSTSNATSWNPGITGTSVLSLVFDSTNVYVGGIFTLAGGSSRNNVAAIDASTGAILTWNPNITGASVSSIAVHSSRVVFGGQYTLVGGATANNLASVDSSTGGLTSAFVNPFWGTLLFNTFHFDYTPVSIAP